MFALTKAAARRISKNTAISLRWLSPIDARIGRDPEHQTLVSDLGWFRCCPQSGPSSAQVEKSHLPELDNVINAPAVAFEIELIGEGERRVPSLAARRCQCNLNTPILRAPFGIGVWSNGIAVAMPFCRDKLGLHAL